MARLARMREDVAALRASRAAWHAVHAASRRAAREVYERTCQQADAAMAVLPPAEL